MLINQRINFKLNIMKYRFFYKCLAFILFPMAMYGKADFSVFNLTCEQAENPLGIETQQPRFSWQIRNGILYSRRMKFWLLIRLKCWKIIKEMCGVVGRRIRKNQF